jgi:hypothetical protein
MGDEVIMPSGSVPICSTSTEVVKSVHALEHVGARSRRPESVDDHNILRLNYANAPRTRIS